MIFKSSNVNIMIMFRYFMFALDSYEILLTSA